MRTMTQQAAIQPFNLPPHEKIQQVAAALAQTYGELEWRPRTDPLSELVLTMLSQNTSDTNSFRAFEQMKARFPTWEDVLNAPTDALSEAIRPGGLANIKAPRIQEVLRLIMQERGALNLDFLYDMPVEEAKAWLSGFKGVGPKTVACVLMFACGMPVLPVDTHVYRVSRRLGLINARTNPEKAHQALEAMLPPEQRYPFHIHLITYGRQACKAQRPLCEQCVVRQWCSYYAQVVKRTSSVS